MNIIIYHTRLDTMKYNTIQYKIQGRRSLAHPIPRQSAPKVRTMDQEMENEGVRIEACQTLFITSQCLNSLGNEFSMMRMNLHAENL